MNDQDSRENREQAAGSNGRSRDSIDLADAGKEPIEEEPEVENGGEPEEIFLEEQQPVLSPEQEDFREKYIRLLAEFDNFRKRSRKDLAAERQRGRRDAAERLLVVYDSVSMGLLATREQAEAVRSGLEAIQNQLLGAFGALGITKLKAKGTRFDPQLHEAIAQVPSDEEEGTVIEESRAGFEDEVGLLRPAQVIVSSGKSSE